MKGAFLIFALVACMMLVQMPQAEAAGFGINIDNGFLMLILVLFLFNGGLFGGNRLGGGFGGTSHLQCISFVKDYDSNY